MPNDTMTDMTEKEIDEKYGYPPFDPFKWNRYYLAAMSKGTTQKGQEKHTLVFRHIESDEPLYHNIMYDGNGRMMFASQHNKVLTALVQNKEKTIAEAIRHAKGNKKITIWLKCDMDGKYMNITDVRQSLTAEDKMNEELKEKMDAAKGSEKDGDLPF